MQERTELIRTEVVLHQSSRSYSAPVIQQKPLFRLQMWLYVSLLFFFVFLLSKTNYKETVTARGILQPGQGAQKIVSPVSAMLRRIYVEPGDSVHKGQVLASLSTSLFDYWGRPQQESQIQQFESARGLLRKEMAVQRSLYSRSIAKNKSAMEILRVGRSTITREAEILAAQLQLSKSKLNSLEVLRNNSAISQSYFDQQTIADLDLRLQQEQINGRMLEMKQQLLDAEGAEEFIEFEFEKEHLLTQRELGEIDYRIKQLGNQHVVSVLAAADGIVAAVAADQGKAVLANQPLFSIHPRNDQLAVSLYAPARVQGKLFPGQKILLSYDAFNYQIFGRYTATISQLSQASLDPREQWLPVPGINEPVFKIAATLEQEYVEGPDIYRLQPGMLLTADFVISEMSLLKFIVKPLLGLRGKVW
ncbi:MAG: HlyD family efflux transporter periplasmic adaptor subunit [Pseudohongiella sp.]|nr:HlyD family efflux transporter periplasmic adaptor subunit [Pseudohongiella sp.]